jgi:chaperone required for assembly of F1-ATPase
MHLSSKTLARGRKVFLSRVGSQLQSFSSSPHHHPQIAGRKRFYKSVDIIPILENCGLIKYGIALDGKHLKTPARHPLYFSNYLLSLAIAFEWDSQLAESKRGIVPATMPFMSIASTAIDTVESDPFSARSTCMSFLPTDSLLFWVKEDAQLYEFQEERCQPVIRWIEECFDVQLLVAEDSFTSRLQHPVVTRQKIEAFVNGLVRIYTKLK